MIWKYTLLWIPMVFIAILNGMLRQYGYSPFMAELTAHQVSCVTGIGLFFLYTWGLSRFWPLSSARQSWIIGGIWLILTVAFEFIFGLYAAGHSLARLLADYNLAEGRLWPLVLAAVALLPYTVYRMRRKSA
ncbi:MAG: hypothetical protein R6W75_12940 [Smithellaceae bacterium]